MSFANEVKREIAGLTVDKCCLKAELYEIIRLKSSLSISNLNYKITFTTTAITTARRIVYLIKKLYNVKVQMLIKEQLKLDHKSLYYLIVEENTQAILEDLDLIKPDLSFNDEITKQFITNDCCKSSLLRGAFLSKGSINDPTTNNYHLEIVTNNSKDADFLASILNDIDLDAKITTRPKGEVVYLKRAEHIADFLKYIGAINSLFSFEDLRIKKDLNNYVNRIMNCDVANEQKAIASASKQIQNIEYLDKNYGLINLTPRLMDAVILRTSNPDDSLSQLSDKSEETVDHYISKSGLSHCYKDIDNLVIELKKNKH